MLTALDEGSVESTMTGLMIACLTGAAGNSAGTEAWTMEGAMVVCEELGVGRLKASYG